MNLRLSVLRLLALLMIVPGVFLVLGGVVLGFSNGGIMWALSAAAVGMGIWFVATSIRFLRKPTAEVSTEILGMVSFMVFGMVGRALEQASPDAWGVSQWLEIGPENAALVRALLALVVAWAVFRALRKLFVGQAA